MKGSSSEYGETLLPLLAVIQDFVDNSLLAPSLVLVSFHEISLIILACMEDALIWLVHCSEVFTCSSYSSSNSKQPETSV